MPEREVDLRREPVKLFNPLDKKQLATSVGEALLAAELTSLPPTNRFAGAGIYAIYYSGECPMYSKLTKLNRESAFPIPIYVGKAIPTGGRKGNVEFDARLGNTLYKRLCEHAESIKQTTNLKIVDFQCRHLVVDDIWIPLGESLLIRQFRPAWNVVIDGFGNHDPGSGRYNQQRSPWDVLHPGRGWTLRLALCTRTETELVKEIDKHLS